MHPCRAGSGEQAWDFRFPSGWHRCLAETFLPAVHSELVASSLWKLPLGQKLIAFLLQKWGAVVQVVDNGLLAVNAALLASTAAEPFDLILMDIQMPEMDGYTATATLRRQGYTGRIIALTAHASDDDRDRCLSSGFDSFAVKPIQKDQLYAVCREQLELSFNARQSVVHESSAE